MIWKSALTYLVFSVTGLCYGQLNDNAIELLSNEIFISEKGGIFAITKDDSGITFIKSGTPEKMLKQRNNRLYYVNAITYGRDSIAYDTLFYEFQTLENNQILILSNYFFDKSLPMAEELFPQFFKPSEADPIRLTSLETAIKSKTYELKKIQVREIKGKGIYFQYTPMQILLNYGSRNDTISLIDLSIKDKYLNFINSLAITYAKFGQDYSYKLAKDYIIEFDFITAYCGRDKLDEIVNDVHKMKNASNSKKKQKAK